MNDGFPGIPAGVDVAFVWGGNGKIYFFKGSQYWKFDPERKPHVRSDHYPKSISLWDLPNNMEAALQWDNGRTYFFKSGNYWRFNDRRFTIDKGDPSFPRPTAQWWFGCPKSKQFSKALGKAEDAVVALFQKGQLETDDYEDDYDYVGDDDLVEPIHK
jgi:matrix metalloproteinase-14 (membrane-inserted)